MRIEIMRESGLDMYDLAHKLFVVSESESASRAAKEFADGLGLFYTTGCVGSDITPRSLSEKDEWMYAAYILCFSDDGCKLCWFEGKKKLALQVDFIHGANAHRRKFGGGKSQAIAKAVGVQTQFKPNVLDCTAGQGGDAFVLATLGCRVTMLERSPVAHILLSDALLRANIFAESDDTELKSIIERLSLHLSSSSDFLEHNIGSVKESSASHSQLENKMFDVVYLDPMFPVRKKSALVKKEMRVFHDLIGKDEDADSLFSLAKRSALYRVVVKRPKGAPFLNQCAPTYTLDGKSTRFDIYAIKAIPNAQP